MTLMTLPYHFTVCKVATVQDIPFASDFCFVGKTDEELSVVCLTDHVPTETVAREDGWRAFRIEGILDFSLVGVLASISGTLAAAGIGLFAVSTFHTDYILVKQTALFRAQDALARAGYTVCGMQTEE